MKLLPLGSVVKLKKGTQKIMIIARLPLMKQNETIGYFDYSACLYPSGMSGTDSFFFNHEDIDEVFFEGLIDEDEQDYQKRVKEEIPKIKYPKLSL